MIPNFILLEGNSTPLQYSCLENPIDGGAWKAAVHGVTEGRTRLSDFTFTFHFQALEKEMATHSSVLAWRIPRTGEPFGLPSMGLHRVGHDWSDLVAGRLTYGYTSTKLILLYLKRMSFCRNPQGLLSVDQRYLSARSFVTLSKKSKSWQFNSNLNCRKMDSPSFVYFLIKGNGFIFAILPLLLNEQTRTD